MNKIRYAVMVEPTSQDNICRCTGEVWVGGDESNNEFYVAEHQRGLWATKAEADQVVTEPWEIVVEVGGETQEKISVGCEQSLGEREEAVNKKAIPANAPSALNAGVGAVLTYTDHGCYGACGNTIGADGAGDYAVLFMGDPAASVLAAREYIAGLPAHSRVSKVCIVDAQEGYCGCPISTIVVPNAEFNQGENHEIP